MRRILGIAIITLYVIAVGCQKDNEVDPKIETTSLTATSGFTLLASGNVIETGSYPIVSYGFAYSFTNSFDSSYPYIVSLGDKPTKGSFQTTVTPVIDNYYYYNQNSPIYVRAYLTNKKGTVYGEVKQISLPTVTVSSVSPLAGKAGDHITITGTNFSTIPSSNSVQFNSTNAKVLEATPTKLVVEVPSGVTSDYYSYNGVTITLNTEAGKVYATQNFNLLPTVTGMSPQSGTFGTSVTIYGSNFSTPYYSYNYAVNVGGVGAYSTNVTSNSITFTIPSTVTTETLNVSVLSGNTSVDVPGQFTINKPTITSFSPQSGIGGTSVTITGQNFNNSYYSYGNKVTVGGQSANIQSSSATQITFNVPNLSQGTYDVSVFTGVHTVVASSQFTVTSPQISSFQPQAAPRGTYVTISGSNFGPNSYYYSSVLFGTTQVSVYSWTNNSITVYLPTYMPQGTMKITVNAGGQSVVSTDSFTVQ